MDKRNDEFLRREGVDFEVGDPEVLAKLGEHYTAENFSELMSNLGLTTNDARMGRLVSYLLVSTLLVDLARSGLSIRQLSDAYNCTDEFTKREVGLIVRNILDQIRLKSDPDSTP